MSAVFNDKIGQMTPGETMAFPGPISNPALGEMWATLLEINEKGVYVVKLTLAGVFFGMLHGRPDGSSWRFTGGT
jgi:hypothetical protein